jgi:hypothetical protein
VFSTGAAVPTTDTLVASTIGAAWSTPAPSGSSGTYSTAVYRETDGNLDFVYQFTNNGPNTVTGASSQAFGAFTTDVTFVTNPTALPPGTYFTPTGTVNPTLVQRDPTGASVTWVFSGANVIGPGQTSETLIVDTNATNYTTGLIGIQAGPTTNVMGYMPAAGTSVPEPAMFLPAGAALLGLLAFRRKAQSRA